MNNSVGAADCLYSDSRRERVEAEVSLGSIAHNYGIIEKAAQNSRVIAVVKANAYGHGAARVAGELLSLGCKSFAVACIDEARDLLPHAGGAEILILGVTPHIRAAELCEGGFCQAVVSLEYARLLNAAVAELKKGEKLKIHVKIDTGMSRFGVYCHTARDISRAADETEAISRLENLEISGIFTHFAKSEDKFSDMTLRQYGVFTALLCELEKRKVNVGTRHCSNSSAILNYPEMRLDAVRAGLALYTKPFPGADEAALALTGEKFQTAMRLSALVVQLRDIRAGDTVSYGGSFRAEKDMRVAVVSIGYGDGYSRLFSGKDELLIRGQRAPVIGNICMDVCVVDASGLKIEPGDTALVFGEEKTAAELAAKIGTIDYEIYCMLSERVKRRYV